MQQQDRERPAGGLTRRRFLQAGVAGATGLALSGVSGWLKQAMAQLPPGSYNPQLQLSFPVEPGASLRILRWSQFVSTDQPTYERMAQDFTRRTGVPVRLEYEAWPDVQPKAAAAANVGAGPDIVLGFFDEPHLWPDKLVPVTDLADYLGRKYGGWFPDRKSTRLNSSHLVISYAVFCLKKKKKIIRR